jgi:HAD superfamily hydrolase (TIGR01549 family)
MKAKQVKSIILDFSGTLAYKEQSVKREEVLEVLSKSVESTGKDIGPQDWDAAYFYVFFIDFPREKFASYEEFLSKVLDRLSIDASEELVREIAGLYSKHNQWVLYPEVREVVEALSGKFELAIDTTIPSFVVNPTLGELASHFAFIGTGDTVGKAKGSKTYYLTIAEAVKTEPGECLIVGDDCHLDVEMPHSLGFQTAFLRRNSESRCEAADFHIGTLREIESIVYRSDLP